MQGQKEKENSFDLIIQMAPRNLVERTTVKGNDITIWTSVFHFPGCLASWFKV
jgi:hypothetical protein